MHIADNVVMCLGEFNGHVGRHIDGFDGVHGGYDVGQRNMEGRMFLEFCLKTELCISNTWFQREEKRKATFRMGENKTENDLVLIKREHPHFLQNVKAMPGKLQHVLVVAEIDKKKIRNVMRKTYIQRREISLLKM